MVGKQLCTGNGPGRSSRANAKLSALSETVTTLSPNVSPPARRMGSSGPVVLQVHRPGGDRMKVGSPNGPPNGSPNRSRQRIRGADADAASVGRVGWASGQRRRDGAAFRVAGG